MTPDAFAGFFFGMAGAEAAFIVLLFVSSFIYVPK